MMKKFLPFLLLILLVTPFVVAAASNPCSTGGNLGECVARVYIWSLGISAILAVAMVVFGGYLVMSARGNGEQATRGKSYLVSSLVGMLLLMGAYILLNTINPELTDFATPSLDSTTAPSGGGAGTTPSTTPANTTQPSPTMLPTTP